MNSIGIDRADFDDMFGFRNRDARGRSHNWIEVTCGLPVNKVAPPVGLPRFHESEIGLEGAFKHVHAAIEFTRLLAFGDDSTVSGWRKKSRHTGASCTHAFGESTLWNQLNFKLPGESQLFEQLVLSHIRGDYFSDLARFEENSHAQTVDAGVV